MLQHPYSFLQSARFHCKKIYNYDPELADAVDPEFKNEFERLGQLRWPEKSHPLQGYQPLVREYIVLLSRAVKVLVHLQLQTEIENKPKEHLHRRMKEIMKDLRYHSTHVTKIENWQS